MKQFFKKNKKTILVASGVVVGALILYKFFNNKDKVQFVTGTDSSSNQTGATTIVYAQNGMPFNAQKVADTLWNLMNQMTNKSAEVLQVLKTRMPLNPIYYDDVYNAFGLKPYNKYVGYNTPFGNADYDLNNMLKEELRSEHYATVKAMFPNQIWK